MNKLIISSVSYKHNIIVHSFFIALHVSCIRFKKFDYKKVISDQTNRDGEILKVKDFITGWLKGETSRGNPSASLALKDSSMWNKITKVTQYIEYYSKQTNE